MLIPANSTLIIEIKCHQILPPPIGVPCSKGEHCPDGKPCPASGTCPAPAPPPAPPAPPPPPPAPPPPPTPGSKCTGLAAGDCDAWVDLFDAAVRFFPVFCDLQSKMQNLPFVLQCFD